MNNLFFILILTCFNVFAGTTPTKLYLLSNILPSQVRPNTQIHLTAKPKDGSNIDYQFEEIKDGVTTILQSYSSNTEIDYNVPSTFKEITIRLSAHGYADIDISTSFTINFKSSFTFSKNKVYQLEEIIVEHPGLVLGNDYKVTLVGTGGVNYEALAKVPESGKMIMSIPRVSFSKDIIAEKFEIKVAGVHTYRRQFIEIYNAPAISSINNVTKKGEPLIINFLESIVLANDSYDGTVDGATAKLLKMDDHSIALDTYNLSLGEHEVNFSYSGFDFKYKFNVVTGTEIADPKPYINNRLDNIETDFGSISQNFPPEAGGVLQQSILDLKNALPNLSESDSKRLAAFFADVIATQGSLRKRKIRKEKAPLTPEEEIIAYDQEINDQTSSMSKELAAFLLIRAGATFDFLTLPLRGAVNVVAAAVVSDRLVNESLDLQTLHVTSAWVKDTSVNDEIDLTTSFKSGAFHKVKITAQYRNINKDDGDHPNFKVRNIFNRLTFQKTRYDDAFSFLLRPFRSDRFFDIKNVTASSPRTFVADPNKYKIGRIFIKKDDNYISTSEIWKVGEEVPVGNLLGVKFKTKLKTTTQFAFELVYDFSEFGYNNDISLIESSIDPGYGCDGADGDFHTNPDGTFYGPIGGFVASTSSVSSTIGLHANTQVCGKSSIRGKNVLLYADRYDDVDVDGEEIILAGASKVKVRGNTVHVSVKSVNSSFNGKNIRVSLTPNGSNSISVSGAAISGHSISIERSFINANVTSTTDCPGDPSNQQVPWADGITIRNAEVYAPITGCYIGVSVTCSRTQHNIINAPISGYNLWVINYTLNEPFVGINLPRKRNFAPSCKENDGDLLLRK